MALSASLGGGEKSQGINCIRPAGLGPVGVGGIQPRVTGLYGYLVFMALKYKSFFGLIVSSNSQLGFFNRLFQFLFFGGLFRPL